MARPEYTEAPRPPRTGRPPFWMVSAGLVAVSASLLGLALIALARSSRSASPPIQIFQDMSAQPRYGAQDASDLFADGRAMRPRIDGTVARGQLQEDDFYYRGFKVEGSGFRVQGSGESSALNPEPRTQNPAATTRSTQPTSRPTTFFDGYPPQVTMSDELLRRGQERFNIYCAVCHGQDGAGNGPVHVRATELMEPKWLPPTSLHSDIVLGRSNGHLYNTINVGIRNMPGYGAQIPVADRWAIVAYVRALQLSQRAPADLVSKERLEGLR